MLKKGVLLLLGLALLFPACEKREEGPAESLLREKDREFIHSTLGAMSGEVRLVLVTSRESCEFCELTEDFLGDIAVLAPGVAVEVIDLEGNAPGAGEFGIERAPGIAILGEKDYGVRYYGLPTGFEFITFIETIRAVAVGDPGLPPEFLTALASLEKPVTLTVFSTKT